MPLGFFLHRGARPTADRLLAQLRAPCPVLIAVGPPPWPAPPAAATMGALNAYLGAVERLEHLAAGRIAIEGQWMEPARGAAACGRHRYGVVAQLRTGPKGLEALGGRLAQAAAELGQQLRFGYGLGLAVPADDVSPAGRIASLVELLERAVADCAEGRRLAVVTRRVEAGRAGRWRGMAASDWLVGALRLAARRERGARVRLYVTLVDRIAVAGGRERCAAARLAAAGLAPPCCAQPPASGLPESFGALPPASLSVRPPSIKCRTASR